MLTSIFRAVLILAFLFANVAFSQEISNNENYEEGSLSDYEQDLEEYQVLKLVRFVDFIFYAGFQFSFFGEPNSIRFLTSELEHLKRMRNESEPSSPYRDGLDDSAPPFGFNFGFDVYYRDLGFSFNYIRNNFFRSDASIQRISNQDDYVRYTYNMAGNSFIFSFLYRFPLLKNPENNVFLVIGTGYGYNFGKISLREEINSLRADGSVDHSSRQDDFDAQAHSGHFTFEILAKLSNFIIATGINWQLLFFNDLKGDNTILTANPPPSSFNLVNSPYLYLKIGFTF